MKIAVTGATGFVGGNVVRRLLDEGHEVIGYGRRPHHELVGHPRFEYVRWDISEGPAAAPAVDAAVHCAGSVTEWGTDAEFDAANVAGTRNVLSTFGAAARFVHISTASVYDLTVAKEGVDEDTPLTRTFLSGYARTKIQAERLVAASRGDSVVLRPHVVYGIGEAKILPRLLAMRRSGAVVVAGNGRNRLSLTHVDNLTDAIVAALARRHGNEVFNIADSVTATLDELLTSLQRAFGFEPRILHMPERALWPAALGVEVLHRNVLRGRTPRLTRFLVAQLAHDFTLDCGRARAALGYRPRRWYAEAFRELATRTSDAGRALAGAL